PIFSARLKSSTSTGSDRRYRRGEPSRKRPGPVADLPESGQLVRIVTASRPSLAEASDRTPTAERRANASAMRSPTDGYSPGFVRWFARIFWPFARIWFRPRVEGFEGIPRAPCMFVGNHSAYGVMEIFVLLCIWTRRFGTRRPAVGLSHDVGMKW